MKILIILPFFLVLFQTSAFPQSGTDIPGGPVSGTWTVENSPYRIQGSINIPNLDTLEIEPGVQVLFKGHYSLQVFGTILAIGTSEDTIVFSRTDTAGLYIADDTAGSWNGIVFDNDLYEMKGCGTSILQYCRISHAKVLAAGRGLGAGIYCRRLSALIVEHCQIINCVSGNEGGGIACLNTGSPVFRYNFIAFNHAETAGGGISLSNAVTALIYENIIVHNISGDYGGGIGCAWSEARILNNVIANNLGNRGGGISLINTSREELFGNLIVNNSANAGGGILLGGYSRDIVNNTVAYNDAPTGPGIAMYGTYYSNVSNNIFWKNTSGAHAEQIYMANSALAPLVTNCIIEGGPSGLFVDDGNDFYGTYEANLDEDPDFILAAPGSGYISEWTEKNFRISDVSPAINKGNDEPASAYHQSEDFFGESRILHGTIDIGASEAHIRSVAASGDITDSTVWMADTVLVTGDIFIRDQGTLIIALGTKVVFAGYYELHNRGRMIARGTPGDPIVFTSADTSGFHDNVNLSGAWKGITMNNDYNGALGAMSDNDTTVFENCIIEYAKDFNNDWAYPFGGGIKVASFSRLIIRNCEIRYNKSYTGGGLFIGNYSSPLILNNSIHHNLATNRGGGMVLGEGGTPLITGNIFSNNLCLEGDFYPEGGGLLIQNSFAVFQNNIICNNEAVYGAGGISISGGKMQFSNNLIVNNKSRNFLSGGLSLGPGSTVIYNTVISGNSSTDHSRNQVFYWSDAVFDHCNIEGGMEEIGQDPNSTFGITFKDVTDDPSGFAAPTSGAGLGFDGTAADWSISDFSALINRGLNAIPDFSLPVRDFGGNPRINQDVVDIGAYENKAKPLAFMEQPYNAIACMGDTVDFSCQADGPSQYQWFRDGTPLSGATDPNLSLSSVDASEEAVYTCRIRNGYGELNSNGAGLIVRSPPEILLQPVNRYLVEGKSASVEVVAAGTSPIQFQWYKNRIPISGETRTRLDFAEFQNSDEGFYNCRLTNFCGQVSATDFMLYAAPQICMVTIDTVSGKNLIIWEKHSIAPIESYNIYRESVVKGEYEVLDNLLAEDLSVYVDTSANPLEQSYIYKITATDAWGVESSLDQCKPHKTIHLLTSLNTEFNTAQLDWDEYYGFDYGTYFIYRSDNTIGFSHIKDISASFRTWLDTDAEAGKRFYYRVAVERPEACYPTGNLKKSGSGIKAGTGPYKHSLSNLDDNKKLITGQAYTLVQELRIYPNPSDAGVTILVPGDPGAGYNLKMSDISGKIIIMESNVPAGEYHLDRGDLDPGFYQVELSREGKVFRGRLIRK